MCVDHVCLGLYLLYSMKVATQHACERFLELLIGERIAQRIDRTVHVAENVAQLQIWHLRLKCKEALT